MNAFLISPFAAGSYSAPVTTFLGSADAAGMRTAMGLGTTGSPTFLAQSLTGQSLTGTQETNLLDLATTWDTVGTPTGIKLDVTNTNSNPAALLMDLQVDGLSKFNVAKGGGFSFRSGATFASVSTDGAGRILLNGSTSAGVRVAGDLHIGTGNLVLIQDAPGILAQRNGVNAQAFRVFNTFLGTTANEWAELDWKTDGTLRLGTNQAGTGAIKSVNFVVGGTARWGISGTTNPLTTGHLLATEDNAYDIGASGKNRPRIVYAARSVQAGSGNGGGFVIGAFGSVTSYANGVFTWWNSSVNDFGRFQLGGTTSAFPAIKRTGAGIDIVLANDSGFAPVRGKLTTDTAFVSGVAAATGYLTLYESNGTAYRVWCTPA